MVYVIIAAILIYCMVVFVPVRLAIFHPIKTIRYAVTDTYYYFKHRDFDRYDGGLLNCYFAHFGGGKTLSASEYVCELFRKYNNKKVWDRDIKNPVLIYGLTNVGFVAYSISSAS